LTGSSSGHSGHRNSENINDFLDVKFAGRDASNSSGIIRMSRKAQVLDLQTARAAAVRTQRQIAGINDPNQGPKRRRYSPEVMNAFTMSAAMKLPPAVLSFIARCAKEAFLRDLCGNFIIDLRQS
jgi:hypothetical protein